LAKRKIVGISCFLLLFLFAPLAYAHGTLTAAVSPVSAFLISPAFEKLSVTNNFTLTVNLTNAQNLFDWQIVLKYNGTGLILNDLWVPADNVFAGHTVNMPSPITAYYPDVIDGFSSAIIGAGLLGADFIANVDSGVLCKANFTINSTGPSLIEVADKSNPLHVGPDYLWYSFWQNTTDVPVSGEQDALGSNCTVFTVSPLVGDLNGDFKVDMRDVSIVTAAFWAVPGDSRWNPTADITGPKPDVPDGKIDIRDVALVARNFGQHYP
jgi:hypothetical protein